jgi:peptide/nickel transport system permease protein
VTKYALRRILLLLPTLWLAVTVLFILLRLVPGDTVTLLFDNTQYSQEDYEEARDRLGLNDSVPVQYVKFVRQCFTGDFGTSIWSGREVTEEFVQNRLPVTLELGVITAVMAIIMGVATGIFAALRQDSFSDLSVRVFAILGLAIPGFWIATLVIVLPSYWWQWSLPVGYRTLAADPWGHAQQMVIPAFLLSLSSAAVLMRFTRSMMVEVLRQDYVRTARAKGLRSSTVVMRHCLRNAMIPLVSVAGLQVAFIITGTVIFETIFSLPGVGTYLFQAISRRDYPVVQGVAVFLTFWVLLVNLVVDLTYPLLDPRIRV